ncbi:Asp-tRNA(Asn)/Glu-tRNA(Gln) amidotransferase GatCAB subunit A, partial [Patescibacteria group bacterium]|nr:Asp-tRNA(Asn)/Glu-tRNA(Gln) amidotransferase GatCAB subunit A [Patescibacteria group bacterium]
MSLSGWTIRELSDALAKGEASSVDVTQSYLNEIKSRGPQLNAVLSVLEDAAESAARASDERRARGETVGVLDGVPIALKDNMCLEGSRTTAASRLLEEYRAPYTAT